MHLVHPDTPELRAQRDQLLQHELRPGGSALTVAAEYPLVLGPAQSQYSYCLMDAGSMVAHANLWPRAVVLPGAAAAGDGALGGGRGVALAIGLVGNVATTASRQGQGLMTQLLGLVQAAAQEQGLTALLLWSDLQGFYQKLGFASYAAERRYLFRPEHLPVAPGPAFQRAAADALTSSDLERLLALRPVVGPVLERSTAEFRALLNIPQMTLVIRRVGGVIDAFALIGKGDDMNGVVHEWGGATLALVLGAVRAAAAAQAVVMLLAPSGLADAWHAELCERAASWEECPMALAWRGDALDAWLAQQRQGQAGAAERQLFVWGLDAI